MKAISHYWPRECVFVLTHDGWCVPALTALLTRQLGLAGIGCSGLAYDSASDLIRLRWRIARHDRSWPCGRCMFDALISNDQYLSVKLVESSKARAVICIQRPAETLVGLVRSGSVTSMSAAEYVYRVRLDWLTAAGRRLGERGLVFPAELVVEDTNTLLAAIALHTGVERFFKPVAKSLLDEIDDEDCALIPRSAERCATLEDTCLLERCDYAYHDALLELSRSCLSIGIPAMEPAQGIEVTPSFQHGSIRTSPRRAEVESGLVCDRLPEGTFQ
jgi:hypothetical protein